MPLLESPAKSTQSGDSNLGGSLGVLASVVSCMDHHWPGMPLRRVLTTGQPVDPSFRCFKPEVSE